MKKTVSLALAASALLLVAADEPAAPGFCERLGSQIGLKEVQVSKRGATYSEWKSEQMGLLKKHLIGGTMMVSFGVQPGSTGDYNADSARATETCQQVGKSMICRPQAPDTLMIGTAQGEGKEKVREGERPVVELRGTAVVCRNG
ncbi:MAG: hypothetical protein R3D89_12570 [Sphingomonadaceae bacterium]